MNKSEVKRQLRKFVKLLGEHNKKNRWRTEPFENGLFIGAWLAYDSVLYGGKSCECLEEKKK